MRIFTMCFASSWTQGSIRSKKEAIQKAGNFQRRPPSSLRLQNVLMLLDADTLYRLAV